MRNLKQSTATDRLVFMTDSGDHVSGKAGLTLTITASKAGAAFGSISPTVTERGNGWYSVALTSSHTDTLGDLALHITGTGADPADLLFNVTANILGDTLPANVTQIGGGAQSATDLKDLVDTGYDPATHKLEEVKVLTGHTAQTGDGYAVLNNGTYGNSALKTLIDAVAAQITGLNNLSALANLYGSPLLEIPDSGTTQFAFTLVVRDSEGKLVDLDASPTVTAANAAGTDRSSNLSAVSHPATGRYTFTYGVAAAAAEESLRITCSGAVSAEGRYIEWIGAVVNYNTLTTLAAIEADTQDIQSRLPAALVGGRMDSSVGAKQVGVGLTAQEKADVNTEADTALDDAGIPAAVVDQIEPVTGLPYSLLLRLAAANPAGNYSGPAAGQAGAAKLTDVGVALAGSGNLVEATVAANGSSRAATVNP